MRVKNPSPKLQAAAMACVESGPYDAFTYRGRRYRMIRCTGAAHSNPYIDNCLACAPMWGWILSDEGKVGA